MDLTPGKVALFAALLAGLAIHAQPAAPQRIDLVITGGHDTDPRDRGRPDVLIAAALGVPTDVFREAFSHVTPAPAGRDPDPEQVRRNHQAIDRALGPYGVTEDRIDAVSDYYRYNRSRGEELWKATPSVAYATVVDGKVTGFTIANPGAGYSSEPGISIPGMPDVKLTVKLAFSKDLSRNGSIAEIVLPPAK